MALSSTQIDEIFSGKPGTSVTASESPCLRADRGDRELPSRFGRFQILGFLNNRTARARCRHARDAFGGEDVPTGFTRRA